MQSLQETLDTPIYAVADVIVCGGGPAGCAAALAAAQMGVKVILLEDFGFLGGVPTAAGVNGIGSWFYEPDGQVLISGIPQKIITDAYLRNGGSKSEIDRIFSPLDHTPDYQNTFGGNWIPVNPEILKITLDSLMAQAQVQVILDAKIVKPVTDGKSVKGIIYESKSGRRAILGHTVIDATGDGEVAARAGAKFEIGRPEDHLCQPMTQIFATYDTDYPDMYYGFGQDPETDPLVRNRFQLAVKQARELGILRENPNDIFCAATMLHPECRTVRAVNFTRVQKLSSTDDTEFTQALMQGRRQVAEAMDFIHQYVPGGKSAKLAMMYPNIGIREGRRITGETVLTGDDIIAGRRFPDAIARGIYLLDIHNPDEVGVPSQLIRLNQPYDIPYRALIPQGLTGILTAGRCISGDNIALSSYRIVSHCMATGEAAGTAAALAAIQRLPAREIPAAMLQQTLRRNGANPTGNFTDPVLYCNKTSSTN